MLSQVWSETISPKVSEEQLKKTLDGSGSLARVYTHTSACTHTGTHGPMQCKIPEAWACLANAHRCTQHAHVFMPVTLMDVFTNACMFGNPPAYTHTHAHRH